MTVDMYHYGTFKGSGVSQPVNNVYHFNNPAAEAREIAVGNANYGFDTVLNFKIYDYYLVVSFWADVSDESEFTFTPSRMAFRQTPCDDSSQWWVCNDYSLYHFDSLSQIGFTAIGKVNSGMGSSLLGNFNLIDQGDTYKIPANLYMSGVLIPIEKSSTAADLSAILGKLEDINKNISHGNEIQQSIKEFLEEQYKMEPDENFGINDITSEIEDKMGVLSFGSDVMIQFLDMFQNANVSAAKLTLPGFSISVAGQSYKVWNDQTFNFNQLNNWFPGLMSIIRTMLPVFVWLMVLKYCIKVFENNFLSK